MNVISCAFEPWLPTLRETCSPPAVGWVEVDGDLLGAGAATAIAQIEDNFRPAAGGGRTGSGAGSDAVATKVKDNFRSAVQSGTGAGSALRARPSSKSALERTESGLCPCQVARLQGLSDGCKILLPLWSRERVSAGERAALAELNNVVVSRLSAP